jgi:putative ABC transport system permease protein
LLLLVWYTKDLWLTLWTLLSIVSICLVFGVLAWALLKGGRVAGMQAKSGWRLALAGLQRRRAENTAQILIFGVAIMLLLVLVLIRTALIEEWQNQVPEDAANHFVMNIAEDEVAGVRALVRDRATEGEFLFPMIRGRVAQVNELSAKEWQAQKRPGYVGSQLTSERALTWSLEAPGNNEIVAGRWWAEDSQEAEASLELDYAQDFGLELGDRMEFDVGGRRVWATVTSIRSLEWESMTPNFFIILSPGALQDFPATYMTSFYLDPTEKVFLNTLLGQYPTITVIEIDALIAQVQKIVGQVSQAVELVLALVLLSGALVLIASIQASRDTRMAEHGLIRALGGTRSLIGGSLTVEFLVLGTFAGVVAVFGAELVVAMLQTQVFDLQMELHPWIWLLGPVAGALIIATVGLLGSRSLIDTPPMSVLRGLY